MAFAAAFFIRGEACAAPDWLFRAKITAFAAAAALRLGEEGRDGILLALGSAGRTTRTRLGLGGFLRATEEPTAVPPTILCACQQCLLSLPTSYQDGYWYDGCVIDDGELMIIAMVMIMM